MDLILLQSQLPDIDYEALLKYGPMGLGAIVLILAIIVPGERFKRFTNLGIILVLISLVQFAIPFILNDEPAPPPIGPKIEVQVSYGDHHNLGNDDIIRLTFASSSSKKIGRINLKGKQIIAEGEIPFFAEKISKFAVTLHQTSSNDTCHIQNMTITGIGVGNDFSKEVLFCQDADGSALFKGRTITKDWCRLDDNPDLVINCNIGCHWSD